MALLIVVAVVAGYVVNRWWIVFIIAGAMGADSMVSHNTGFRLLATAVLGAGLAALGVYSRRRPSMFRRHAQTVAARVNKESLVDIVKEQRDLAVERVAPAEMRDAIRKTTSNAVERVAPPERREAIRKTTSGAVERVTTPGMRDAVRNGADAAKTKLLSPELRESIGRSAQQALAKAKSPEVREAIERGKQQAISTAKDPPNAQRRRKRRRSIDPSRAEPDAPHIAAKGPSGVRLLSAQGPGRARRAARNRAANQTARPARRVLGRASSPVRGNVRTHISRNRHQWIGGTVRRAPNRAHTRASEGQTG